MGKIGIVAPEGRGGEPHLASLGRLARRHQTMAGPDGERHQWLPLPLQSGVEQEEPGSRGAADDVVGIGPFRTLTDRLGSRGGSCWPPLGGGLVRISHPGQIEAHKRSQGRRVRCRDRRRSPTCRSPFPGSDSLAPPRAAFCQAGSWVASNSMRVEGDDPRHPVVEVEPDRFRLQGIGGPAGAALDRLGAPVDPAGAANRHLEPLAGGTAAQRRRDPLRAPAGGRRRRRGHGNEIASCTLRESEQEETIFSL